MGNAVKVTVIATGFSRQSARKAAPTPVDLANYMTTPSGQAPAVAAAGGAPGDFYRKTPNPKAAAGGGSRFDLDVPAFLRRKGGDGSGSE
jgi:hypothetical protein